MKWIASILFFLLMVFAGKSWAYSGACNGFWTDIFKANSFHARQIGNVKELCISQPNTMVEEIALLEKQGDKCVSVCKLKSSPKHSPNIGKNTRWKRLALCTDICAYVETKEKAYVKGYYHGIRRGQSASSSSPEKLQVPKGDR